MVLKSYNVNPLNFSSSLRFFKAILSSLHFQVHIRIDLSISTKKPAVILIGITLDL